MENLPKVIKAEMLPRVRLRLEFDNGQVRYYPVHEQIDFLMNPFDVSKLKKTYGANLFLGGMVSWIGNEIKIEPNGDLLLNDSVIPAELLWEHSLKHIDSMDPEKLKELEEIKQVFLEEPPSAKIIASKQDIFQFFGITPQNLFECFVDSDCEFLIDRLIELCDLAMEKNRPIMFQ